MNIKKSYRKLIDSAFEYHRQTIAATSRQTAYCLFVMLKLSYLTLKMREFGFYFCTFAIDKEKDAKNVNNAGLLRAAPLAMTRETDSSLRAINGETIRKNCDNKGLFFKKTHSALYGS
jgi:hypothetical protein